MLKETGVTLEIIVSMWKILQQKEPDDYVIEGGNIRLI